MNEWDEGWMDLGEPGDGEVWEDEDDVTIAALSAWMEIDGDDDLADAQREALVAIAQAAIAREEPGRGRPGERGEEARGRPGAQQERRRRARLRPRRGGPAPAGPPTHVHEHWAEGGRGSRPVSARQPVTSAGSRADASASSRAARGAPRAASVLDRRATGREHPQGEPAQSRRRPTGGGDSRLQARERPRIHPRMRPQRDAEERGPAQPADHEATGRRHRTHAQPAGPSDLRGQGARRVREPRGDRRQRRPSAPSARGSEPRPAAGRRSSSESAASDLADLSEIDKRRLGRFSMERAKAAQKGERPAHHRPDPVAQAAPAGRGPRTDVTRSGSSPRPWANPSSEAGREVASAESTPSRSLGPAGRETRPSPPASPRVVNEVAPEAAAPTGLDLAAWRARLALTQQAAADRLGVRQGTISKAEARRGRPLGPTVAQALRQERATEELATESRSG